MRPLCSAAGGRGALRNLAIAAGIVALAFGFGWWDAEKGFRTWLGLKRELAAVDGRVAEARSRIAAARAEAEALRDDPLAQERAIRQDLRLARPGETVVRMSGGPGESPQPR